MNNKKINRNTMLVKRSDNQAQIVSMVCSTIKTVLLCSCFVFSLYIAWDVLKAPNSTNISENANTVASMIERLLKALGIDKIADFIPWSGWGVATVTIIYHRIVIKVKTNNFKLAIESNKKETIS